MADDAPPHLLQEGAAAGAASAASSLRGSLAGEATEPSPRSSLTGEATGPPRKGKSKLVSLSNKVLMTVKIEAAFGTLRKSAVSDDLDIKLLEFQRELGKGASGKRGTSGADTPGAYGNVSLYKWKPGARVRINGEMVERSGLVAVKSLLPSAAQNEQAIADFKSEMSMLSRLSHSCLVGCIGTGVYKDAKSGEDLLFLAMEAVTGGDLRNAVLKAMGSPNAYNDADVVRWAHDIARGLHYLHTRSPMIIHRDLKLENVMLDAQWNAKITDLGLIKALVRPKAFETQVSATDTYEMTGGTGSLRYLSPENFMGKPYNERSDIYSFSIILWELLARKPLLFMRYKRVGHARVEYTPRLWATDAARESVRPEVLPQWPAELCALMTQCWDADPASRPSAREIVERLHPLLQPERFTDTSKASADASGGCCAVQ